MSPDASASNPLQRLEALLAKGVPFEEAIETINPWLSFKRKLLRRLAFVRQFDRPLFDVIATGTDAGGESTFDQIVRTPGVEVVAPGGEKAGTFVYRIKDGFAAELLKEWLDKDGDAQHQIRTVARQVWDFLTLKSRGTALDRLRFRIAKADPSSQTEKNQILDEFNAAFEEADRTLDLAECHALVRMLIDLDNVTVGGVTAPLRLLSAGLRARCDVLVPYVAVRGRFIQEFAKSATYQQRDLLWKGGTNEKGESTVGVETFLGEKGQGLLSIYGTGGRGKTIFLNWLIARYCLSRSQSIPVGRVDFDDINVSKLEARPELLLVPLAEQLSRQLPAFQDFIDRWGRFAVILTPAPRVPRGVSVEGLEKQLDPVVLNELVETFARKLPRSGRVLLLLDTLEEAVLHHPAALHKVVALCHRLEREQGNGPRSLRILLSGRYNLRDQGQRKQGRFLDAADPAPVEVGPFTYDERVTYLRITRGWEKHQQYLDLIVPIALKAGGNPFILSLVADLVEDGSIQTLDDVLDLKPEFAYLIDRVIKRIPESQRGVRWVIRYGVVPFRLTQDFLVHVMEPHLRRELEATEGEQDKLAQFAKYFPRGGDLRFETLWTDLSTYASDYGWVKATADEIRFQPEVVVPMSALLSSEKIFTRLHRDAEHHFRVKAEIEDAPWSSLMAESLFHLAHLRTPELEKTFEGLLQDPRAQPTAARRELLDAVTRSSFVDEEGHPRLYSFHESVEQDAARSSTPREPIVPPTLIGRAYLELARLGAGIRFGECKLTESESIVKKWLDLSTELRGTQSDHSAVVVQMALAASNRRFDEVLALAESVKVGELEPRDSFAYRVILARAGVAKHDAESFDRAIELLEEAESLLAPSDAAKISLAGEKAATLRAAGHYDRTVMTYDQLVSMAAPTHRLPYMSELSEFYFDYGEFAKAIDVMPVPDTRTLQNSRDGPRLLRTWQLARVDQRVVRSPMAETNASVAAELLEARGAVLVSIGQLIKGIECLERAALQFRDRGDMAACAKATLRLLRTRIDLSGDLTRAERFIPDIDQLDEPLGSLMAIEVGYIRRTEQRPVLPRFSDDWSAAAVRWLSGAQDGGAALQTIARSLQGMESIGLRYQSLRFFKWIRPLPVRGGERFLEWLPSPEPDDPDYLSRAVPLAYCMHALGEPREARRLLQTVFRQAVGREHTAGRDMVQAALSIGCDLPDRESLGNPVEELKVAIDVEYVHGLLDRDREEDAAAWQSDIPDTLPTELGRSLIEVTHLDNLSRLASRRRRVNELRARSRDVSRQLGHESSVVGSPPTPVEAPGQSRPATTVGPLAPAAERPPESRPGGQEAPAFPASIGLPRAVESVSESSVPPEAPPSDRAVTKGVVVVSLASLPDPSNARLTRDRVSFEQVKLLIENDDEVVRRLSMALALPPTLPTNTDVRLVADGGTTHQLPWEWCVGDTALCYRSVEAKMSSLTLGGFLWALVPEWLRRIMRLASPMRVAVVQRAVAQQEASRRGFERTSRRTLADIYKSHGMRATLASSTRLELAELLASRPHVVHLQLPVVERFRQLCVGFGDDDGNDLSVESLLSVWPKDPFWRPLVILDPPRPTDDIETARQLLLRNGFALELFATGRPRAVLGMGLFEPESTELFAERLAHTISANPSMRQVVMLVRREHHDSFAGRGAALFVENPKAAVG